MSEKPIKWPSAKEIRILRFLCDHSAVPGLAIAKGCDLMRGLIYLTLDSMETRGLIISFLVPGTVEPRQRVYSVTVMGLKFVRALNAAEESLREAQR